MNNKQFLQVLKAMANDARLKTLLMLSEPKVHFPQAQSDVNVQGVCLGLIAETLQLSQSTVSSYMSKLEDVGLVESKRQGQWTFYKLCPKKISEIIHMLSQFT